MQLSTSSPYWIRRMVVSWGALVDTPKALQTLGILRYTIEGCAVFSSSSHNVMPHLLHPCLTVNGIPHKIGLGCRSPFG